MLAESREIAFAQGDRGVGGCLHAGMRGSLGESNGNRRAVAVALQSDESAG